MLFLSLYMVRNQLWSGLTKSHQLLAWRGVGVMGLYLEYNTKCKSGLVMCLNTSNSLHKRPENIPEWLAILVECFKVELNAVFFISPGRAGSLCASLQSAQVTPLGLQWRCLLGKWTKIHHSLFYTSRILCKHDFSSFLNTNFLNKHPLKGCVKCHCVKPSYYSHNMTDLAKTTFSLILRRKVGSLQYTTVLPVWWVQKPWHFVITVFPPFAWKKQWADDNFYSII